MASVKISSSKGEYVIHGFVFVDEEKNMYGVREVSSQEGRVWYGLPGIKKPAVLHQFGLSIENISHAELAERIAAQNAAQLNREKNRLQRLQAALEVATDRYTSTPYGTRSDVEFKIQKCQEKIQALGQ